MRVDRRDVLQEDDLSLLEVLVGEGEHFVEGVEEHLDLWSVDATVKIGSLILKISRGF